MKNYWIKDQSRQEIITKTQIPNKGNFNIYANYYNLIDAKGLGLQISSKTDMEIEKLYMKNRFQYFVIEHNRQKDLYILPNDMMVEYVDNIAFKINDCKNEEELLELLIEEMG